MAPGLQYFALPLAVAIIGPLALYLFNQSRQAASVRQALLSEINHRLQEARDYDHYLHRPRHYWLEPGAILKEAPVFVRSRNEILHASLPLMYLLSPPEIERVLRFYDHHSNCERLIEILFGRIAKQESSQKALDADQVAVTRARVQRILSGLQPLGTIPRPVKRLIDLPLTYEMDSVEKTAEKIDALRTNNAISPPSPDAVN